MRSWLLLLVVACSCSSNRALVAKVSATTTYHVATYEHRCQNTGGHPAQGCGPCEATINEAVWQAKVAVVNRDQGYLPPEEIADLERLVAAMGGCP